MRECTVTGCSHPAAGYSTHCEHHRRTQRRHGHPEQEGVTTKELEPYLRRVRARIRKNSASPAWTLLHARWETLVEAAKEAEARYQNGGVFIRHQRRAEGSFASWRRKSKRKPSRPRPWPCICSRRSGPIGSGLMRLSLFSLHGGYVGWPR